MGHKIAQLLAVGQLPGARKGDHKVPAAGLNRLQIRARGIGRIRYHYHFLTPGGQDHLLRSCSRIVGS